MQIYSPTATEQPRSYITVAVLKYVDTIKA